jgi:hypothetical protein
MNRWLGLAGAVLAVACSTGSPSGAAPPVAASAAPGRSAEPAPPTAGPLVLSPPTGAQPAGGGCGQTPVYTGGTLPDWATVNAPRLPYVVGRPGTVIGYLFTPRLTAGDSANNKILWYVATPRDGRALLAAGHPLGAIAPIARFTTAADSSPGEIYPSGPTVPSAGCWRFTLTWLGGAESADVDLAFE